MKTIQIDDDVYTHVASKTLVIGEPAADILRRLLGVSKRETPTDKETPHHELEAHFAKTEFLVLNSTVDKFLYILGVVAKEKGPSFEKVLAIQGRYRKYFAKSRDEIIQSGQSTHPRQIPGTNYWVMTNSPSLQKRYLLFDVLKLFQYSKPAMESLRSII